MWTTGDIIVEADRNIMNFKQPTDQGALEYTQALWTKAIRRGPVYDEYRLKGTFIEELRESIRQISRAFVL